MSEMYDDRNPHDPRYPTNAAGEYPVGERAAHIPVTTDAGVHCAIDGEPWPCDASGEKIAPVSDSGPAVPGDVRPLGVQQGSTADAAADAVAAGSPLTPAYQDQKLATGTMLPRVARPALDPATGRPWADEQGAIDPATGRPWANEQGYPVDEPAVAIDPATGHAINPATGRPWE